jgi:hypothetical protein
MATPYRETSAPVNTVSSDKHRHAVNRTLTSRVVQSRRAEVQAPPCETTNGVVIELASLDGHLVRRYGPGNTPERIDADLCHLMVSGS